MIKLECIKRLYEVDYKSFTLGKNYKITYQDGHFIELLDNRGREISFSKISGSYFHYVFKYFNPNPANKRIVIFEKTSEPFNFKLKQLND